MENLLVELQFLPLDKNHPNYQPPLNARWQCVDGYTVYYNRTLEGLREHVARVAAGAKKTDKPGRTDDAQEPASSVSATVAGDSNEEGGDVGVEEAEEQGVASDS